MPTHRDLARLLQLSVQTVSQSYKEAERLGYLRGEVGRGTFVRSRVTERANSFILDRPSQETVDLSIIRAVYTEQHEAASRAALAHLAASDNSVFMRPCRPIAGLDHHRSAAQIWLSRLGLQAELDRILITNGAAHGVFLALTAIVRPGDIVLTEELTDHGIIGLASVLGFALRGLPTDSEGILPDAFEAACQSSKVTALALIPTLGNPTSHVAGAERRAEIAAIAARHGVFVVEDEVCRPLVAQPLPSITQMLPDLGFYATSFTKSVLTGLRVGYLVVPPAYSMRVASILRVTSWSATPLPAEIASLWVSDGTADALLRIQRVEIAARQAIVREQLGQHLAGSHPASLCAWLRVPERWTEDGLVRALGQRRIAVTPAEPFQAGERRHGGIRICIGGRLSHDALAEALAKVRATCEQLPPLFDAGPIA
jgi:DNA-binding transcriptional MocR family regulator